MFRKIMGKLIPKWWGFFWYSPKMDAAKKLNGGRHYINHMKTITGKVKRYNEWRSNGIFPGNKWGDNIFVGFGRYHTTKRR